MEEKISIVIPLYNTNPKVLEHCLSCIKMQTYSNIEVLCVDGGSFADTLNVINLFLPDERFKLINTHNGVSHQRNIGIENSEGDYILFVDSDDYFGKDFVRLLYENMKNNGADVSIPLLHRCVYLGDELVSDTPYNVGAIYEKVTKQNFFKYARPGELVNPIKLYKKSLIGNTRFDINCSYGEDLLFNYELSKKGFISCFVPDAIYHYRVIMNSNSGERRFHSNGWYIVKVLASIIKSKEIIDKDSIEGLNKDFDFVFTTFYYALARRKKLLRLIWMMQFKWIYLKRHHNIHDILFMLFPIIIVSRRNRKAKKQQSFKPNKKENKNE